MTTNEPRDHTIKIPHALWVAYGGSAMRMRDTLWEALMPVAESEPVEDAGREFTGARYRTVCPLCEEWIEPGDRLWIRTKNGETQSVHYGCAEKAGWIARLKEVVGE